MPALTQAVRLLGQAVEGGRVAGHQPHDAPAALGLLDDDLGAGGVGQRLAVVAEAGVDDLDVGAAVARRRRPRG